MKKITAGLILFWLGSPFASANTFTTDLTDMWWNANESGWGVTATHQREVVFLTFFVYSTDNRPTFYTATATYSGQTGAGALVFSGPMYQTTGPWLGTTFNPGLVSVRQVGTVDFTAFIDAATLAYSVDGTFVTKALTRQTFRNNDLSGSFAGIFKQTSTGCSNPLNAGTTETVAGVAITNSATTLSMTSNASGTICNYVGNYRQSGRMGSSSGTYTCPGVAGNYDMVEIEANPSGITGRFLSQDNLCSQTIGRFAIVTR
ncbi:MAG: hypothetical protein IPP88_07495 [Betaproteobacteria bacterium]|nr:hypothetical protein [Betaproteobacteria bacterium]